MHLLRSLAPTHRAAILGHELQHVNELAQSVVLDGEGLRALYAAIGRTVV